jgi:hypothetical protein
MRKFVPIVAAIAASAAVVALPATSAFATGRVRVLTIKKVGGPAVRAGAVLKAGLVENTKAVFRLGSSGTVKLTCTKASLRATVRANPAKPGTAIESLTAIGVRECTLSGITGATFKSAKALNLPYKVTVSDAMGFPVTVSQTSTTMPIEFTVKVAAGTSTFTCNYKAASVKGTASNTGSKVAFSKQKFTKAAGSNRACLGPAFFSASFGPVRDTSVTNSPRVFVN